MQIKKILLFFLMLVLFFYLVFIPIAYGVGVFLDWTGYFPLTEIINGELIHLLPIYQIGIMLIVATPISLFLFLKSYFIVIKKLFAN